jgi:hypothetical protein
MADASDLDEVDDYLARLRLTGDNSAYRIQFNKQKGVPVEGSDKKKTS